MKKVGFIDYYLDEWHAEAYPDFIRKHSEGRYDVTLAWAEIASPHSGMTSEQWSEKYNIPLAASMEEVIEKCDCLIVLSPDDPERHEDLSRLPLMSGKRTYVDKTFAPDLATAKRIFDVANKHNTPCYSCSALCFVPEYHQLKKDDITAVQMTGPGTYAQYAIHQIEPIIDIMGTDIKRVMAIGTMTHPMLNIEFVGGRYARTAHFDSSGFSAFIGRTDGSSEYIEVKSDLFEQFTKELIAFFDTGIIPIPHEQTLTVIATIEAGALAQKQPFTWVNVER